MEDKFYRAAVVSFTESGLADTASVEDREKYIQAFLLGAKFAVNACIERINEI